MDNTRTNTANKNSNENNLKDKSKSDKKSFWIKQASSIFMLIIVVCFIVPAGLNPDFYSNGYNFFFLSILSILFIYGIFELINMVFPYKEKLSLFLFEFILINIIFLIAFFLFGTYFYNNFNTDFYQGAIIGDFSTWNIFNNDPDFSKKTILFISYLLISVLFFILLNSMLDVKITDLLVIIFVATMFFFFIISVILLLTIFNWAFFMLVILVTSSTDTFAYIGGSKFGKRKLAENISPNKTVEGLEIGLISGIVIGLIWYFGIIFSTDVVAVSTVDGFKDWYIIICIVIFIILTTIIAQLGDLNFSKIKRNYDKKDFSSLIPGHGGLFDRIDSHIFALPIFNFLLILLFI